MGGERHQRRLEVTAERRELGLQGRDRLVVVAPHAVVIFALSEVHREVLVPQDRLDDLARLAGELLEGVGPHELVLDGDAHPTAEIAETIAGVSRVEATDGILRAHSSRGGQILPALIDAAESAGRTVTDIHLLQPSLETLFVSLTGRKLV